MTVKTLLASSPDGIEHQLQAYEKEGFKPTLAIMFSSATHDLKKMSEVFDHHDIDLFGCSTAGEILNDTIYDDASLGLLFDLSREHYSIFFSEYDDHDVFKVSELAGMTARSLFQNPALIIGSGGVTIDAEELVAGLRTGAGNNTPLFGGLAADDLHFKGTFAFSRNKVSENGLVVLILDNDKIEVKGMTTSGWEGVGMENTITKASGNILYTINNEPALDVFIKYFGYFDDATVKGKNVSTISSQYPLQIIRDDGTVVLRAPLIGNEDDKSLILAGGVKEGDKFRFSISPGFEVIDQTIEDFGELRSQVHQADALILFSCKGRHAALGPMIEDEIKGIYNYWNKPMAGFFTYGEIGPGKTGVCEFHNETCSLVLLREK